MTAAPTRPRPTRPRRTRRILAFAGACGLAALSLTGCLDVNADVAPLPKAVVIILTALAASPSARARLFRRRAP